MRPYSWAVPDDLRFERPATPGDGGLTPEEVAYRSFSAARRGISEDEVREFLQEVAAEMADAVGRERDLLARVHELEARVAHPPSPTEEQLLEHLGEETARVLRSAQEAADEIKANATNRAQAIVEEAEAEAGRARALAESLLADRTREAEAAATAIQRDIEGKAQAELRQAARDAHAELEAARQRGREMVSEARAVRERILADLAKRRTALQTELDELRAAREGLIGAGRVVKGSLGGIVDAVSAFDEAARRASAADAPAPPEVAPPEAVAEPEEEAVAEPEDAEPAAGAEAGPEPEGGPEADADAEPEAEAEAEPETEPAAEPEPAEEPEAELEREVDESDADESDAERPAVEELFARIRADRADDVDRARAVLEAEPAPSPAPAPADETDGVEAPAERETPAAEPAEPAEFEAAPADEGEGLDESLLARRDDALEPVRADLLRRCKRALQDEQNDLLDRLRRQRGKVEAEQLLAPLSVEVTDWADVVEPAVDEAYAAGRRAAGGGSAGAGAPRRLVSGLAESLVTPLRERLVATLDGVPGEGADRGAELVARIGARYREWRSQDLEARVGDLLAAAYTRGVYDAAPEGARLRWVPAAANRCADCDDNALEPTARGSAFPTGQQHPPAHPGCRCLVTVIDDA